MALLTAENVTTQAAGFNSLPVLRQLGLMLGLAGSVALGVTVAMWSQTPNYSMLHSNLSAQDLLQVTQSLDSAGIKYKLERGGGIILVPADKIHESRMKLAAQGLLQGDEVGFELLEKSQGFGSSSFLQKARYYRALEGELAQSISKLNLVRSARVHLAITKQSVFARQNSKSSASVVLSLNSGRVLDEMQIAGIVNMVASSVPQLEAELVTVIDQKGRLLSGGGTAGDMLLSSTQFDYTRRLEERYVKNIIDILSPIVGLEGVRAQVVADMDYTTVEQSSESFLPEQMALRSEQVFEEKGGESAAAMGIPGALSNQPPVAGTTENEQMEENSKMSGRSTSRAIRNYELDRTISHTRKSANSLQRLSVAVVLDYHSAINKDGDTNREPLDPEEMERITSLVKKSVGFNEKRGDTINIVNSPFQLPAEVEALPAIPLWKQAWTLLLAKQLLGALVVLFIAFGVLRPMLRNLATQGQNLQSLALLANTEEGQLMAGENNLSLTRQVPGNEQQLMDMASSMAQQEPKRVAQALKTWVASGDG